MKYFSLFDDETIGAAPKKKIIPAEEFSTLEEAIEIVKRVKKEEVIYRKKIEDECELLKKQAYEDGYQKGLEKFNEALAKIDAEIKRLHEDFQKKLLPIALKAAKKILGEELQLHPERITDIVIQALKPVTQHHHIKIYVHPKDLAILEKDKEKIKKIISHIESFSIQERNDIEPGGCIIETEAGIINAQLENQWRAMEAAFKSLMNP